MKIVYAHNEPGPVGWLRVWQWGRAMKSRGHEVWMRADQSEQITKKNVDAVCKGADVVVCGRTHDPESFVLLLAARSLYGFKLVVDTDDNTDEIPPYAHSFEDWHPGSFLRRLIRGEYREADLVTVTTGTLSSVVRKYAKQVEIMPNCVDLAWHAAVRFRDKEKRHDDFRIYWGGGANHYDDLLVVKDALLKVCAERPGVKLIFSNFIPDWAVNELPARRTFVIPVAQFDMYPRVLAWLCADIAIAPLVDNVFNGCKSHIKYLDYAMARIPAVYQDSSAYDTVRHNETGLKARNAADWYSAITYLLSDRDHAKRLAVNALEDVIDNWTVSHWVERYESMLTELVAPQLQEVACQSS